MKCDKCNRPATVHIKEIVGGKQIAKHLCEQCAASSDGLVGQVGKAHAPINELLTNFVLAHSGIPSQTNAICEHCGMSWSEFRQGGLLGCQHDYAAFDKELTPLLAKAHENATHHIGKTPLRRSDSGPAIKRQVDLARLRKELTRAVEAEDYERAAKLRDQIKEAESA